MKMKTCRYFLIPKISSTCFLTLGMMLVAQLSFADSDRLVLADDPPKIEEWVKIEPSSLAADDISFEGHCSGGKQTKELRETFSIKLPATESGIPKDKALLTRKRQINHIRNIAANWFQLGVHPRRLKLHDEYTLFMPKCSNKEEGHNYRTCNVWAVAYEKSVCNEDGDDVKCSKGGEPLASLAIEYRTELWQKYFEVYTTVKEAPSADGVTFKFELSLDLRNACKFARPIKDLITQ